MPYFRSISFVLQPLLTMLMWDVMKRKTSEFLFFSFVISSVFGIKEGGNAVYMVA